MSSTDKKGDHKGSDKAERERTFYATRDKSGRFVSNRGKGVAGDRFSGASILVAAGRVHARRSERAAPSGASTSQRLPGAEQLAVLKKSGAIGMWKDREDIGDSSEYARRLRGRI